MLEIGKNIREGTIPRLLSMLALMFSLTCSVAAQPIPGILYHSDKATELEQYFRDRVLRISYDVEEKSTGKQTTIRGTGFLVSPEGWALTARHVLGPALSSDYDQTSPIVVVGANGTQLENSELVLSSPPVPAAHGDVTLFRVSTPSTAPFDRYFCAERSESPLVPGSKVTIAAWRYYTPKDSPPVWSFSYHPSKDVEQRNGPGDLYEYLGLSHPFERSMSGGAILQNGRVIAVISTSLIDESGTTTADGNYGYLLKYAKDTGWNNGRAAECGRAIDDEVDFIRNATQEKFASTCEGSIAWIPDGKTREFYSFPDSGNYRMRRRDLACDKSICGSCLGKKSPKSVRIVINHSSSPAPEAGCDVEGISGNLLGQKSTFGAQVIPIFKDTALLSTSPETWFYRNTRLFRRNTNGQFSLTTSGVQKDWSPITPSKFSAITRDPGTSLLRRGQKCLNVSDQECDDIYALRAFDDAVELNMPWHGHARKGAHSESTLFGLRAREGWALPTNLLAQDMHVKNWILRYTMTTNRNSTSPVIFDFCINSDWDGFVARSFSSERRLRPKAVHVLLED